MIICAGAAGYGVLNNKVDSIVALDVNPSIELGLNRSERIIDVTACKDDATVILEHGP